MSRWPETPRVRISWAIGLVLALGSAFSQKPDTDWIDYDVLQDGGIQIDFGEDHGFRGLVRAAADIDAPVARVWEILVDCEAAAEYVENIESCELVETLEEGRAQIFRQRAKLRWFLPSVEHEFRLDYEPLYRIRISRVSGPFRRLDAIWWLLPEGGNRTRVVYRLELDPGPLIPDFLLTSPLRRDITNALRVARERAVDPQPQD